MHTASDRRRARVVGAPADANDARDLLNFSRVSNAPVARCLQALEKDRKKKGVHQGPCVVIVTAGTRD